MTEPPRLSGKTIVVAFAALIAVFFGALVYAFWHGPKGQFTQATLAKPLDVPAVVRTFCIDPKIPGPKSLEDFPHCANADRIEFTITPEPGRSPAAAWVLVGPTAVGIVSHAALSGPWAQPIPVKGLPPGGYALVFVFSDHGLDEAALKAVVEPPDGQLARLQALEEWAKTQQKTGADVRLHRVPFQLEAAAG